MCGLIAQTGVMMFPDVASVDFTRLGNLGLRRDEGRVTREKHNPLQNSQALNETTGIKTCERGEWHVMSLFDKIVPGTTEPEKLNSATKEKSSPAFSLFLPCLKNREH